MAEHGQKFVLAPVQVGQRAGLLLRFALQAAAFGGLIAAVDGTGELAAFIGECDDGRDNRHAQSIGAFNEKFLVLQLGIAAHCAIKAGRRA